MNVQFLPENFTAILFHYDGNVNGWNDMPWSKSVIHIAASNQTKWYNISSFALRLGMLFSLFCNKKGHISTFHFFFLVSFSFKTRWQGIYFYRWFAKRFLHPAVVSMYKYIFLWDEDLEVDNFNPRRYCVTWKQPVELIIA